MTYSPLASSAHGRLRNPLELPCHKLQPGNSTTSKVVFPILMAIVLAIETPFLMHQQGPCANMLAMGRTYTSQRLIKGSQKLRAIGVWKPRNLLWFLQKFSHVLLKTYFVFTKRYRTTLNHKKHKYKEISKTWIYFNCGILCSTNRRFSWKPISLRNRISKSHIYRSKKCTRQHLDHQTLGRQEAHFEIFSHSIHLMLASEI